MSYQALCRAIVSAHFAIYQSLLAILTLTVGIHLFSDSSWLLAFGYASVTTVSYWAGQGIVVLAQRPYRAKGSDRE